MVAPFRLRVGDYAPRQQTSTTCGSAALTVARMLVNPAFARWITLGIGIGIGADDRDRDGAVPRRSTPTARFAAYEQVVAGRTNSLVGAGGQLQLPWPRALGTPPWGARRELEFGAADGAAEYDVRWLRLGSRVTLERSYAALRSQVKAGCPALLYIGNRWLPRHVVLVMPSTGDADLDVYEPSVGRVVDLPRERFVTRRLGLAGWDVPWAAVWADQDA